MGRCQKCQNLTFKFNFNVKNYPKLSQFFFHWEILIQEHNFCYWHFLITSTFKSLYFLKWCPVFDTSPSTQFSKFNNFLWACQFLVKIFLIFHLPFWKLHNPYFHKAYHILYLDEIPHRNFSLNYVWSLYVKMHFSEKMQPTTYFPVLLACMDWPRHMSSLGLR